MAISTKIVGREFGPFVREYTFKDLEICALGCNAGYDGKTDLEYLNEGDANNPSLKVLPIFGVPLTVNEEMTRTLDYGYDYAGSLHYGFEITLHAPLQDAHHLAGVAGHCAYDAHVAGGRRGDPLSARGCR